MGNIPGAIKSFIDTIEDTTKDGFEIIRSLLKIVVVLIKKFIDLFPELLKLTDNGFKLALGSLTVLNILIIIGPALLILFYTSKFINKIEGERVETA